MEATNICAKLNQAKGKTKIKRSDMIPRIRKVEPQDLCDGIHIKGYKYKVQTGKDCFMCFDLLHAVEVWFYTLFSRL